MNVHELAERLRNTTIEDLMRFHKRSYGISLDDVDYVRPDEYFAKFGVRLKRIENSWSEKSYRVFSYRHKNLPCHLVVFIIHKIGNTPEIVDSWIQ